MKYKELNSLSPSEFESGLRKYWDSIDIVHKTEETRMGNETWVFYEGPPTANGRPGIHHVISRTLKDAVNKYKTMQGFYVKKKAGWDTHGLPVEIEVEKQLGLNIKRDIEEYGIKDFNEKCRESVFSYEALWREMTNRMAYFVDLDDPYITLDNDYIETEWWILDQFYKQGLMYEGSKILPYCPRCGTGLATHEVALGYKNIITDTVFVKFQLRDSDEKFLVWTTTPWTLASNVALAVGADISYGKYRVGDETLIIAEALAQEVLPDGSTQVGTVKGSDLEGLCYEQLMPFLDLGSKRSLTVELAGFVDIGEGTGIVHMSPAFGEDDYNLAQEKGLAFLNPVNEKGEYTDTPWKGMSVFDADPQIIEWLGEQGKLFKVHRVEHNYPHCWRCSTPLIYYAKPSWYIKVSDLREDLAKANSQVEWYPDYVGEKRFANWLENARDWAISRNRYWGTPLNIWKCECSHIETVGSRSELKEKAVEDIDGDIELHRPYIDEIHLKCPKCGSSMSRVADVIDCWFDSGSMPYAQYHYPFENKELFEQQFPADFICEGIDQTRGWFYSLIVIGTILSKQSPYKRVLVNDLILDKAGQKMSKSKGNTADPFDLFDRYGADAMRWYLLYVSPAWTPTKFDEDGIREIQSKYFNTLRNAYSFFSLYANADDIDASGLSVGIQDREELDRWLISRYNSMLADVAEAMGIFDLTKAVRAIQSFVVDDLSNWYIRRSRRRFWESEMSTNKQSVYLTTYEVLLGLSKAVAPLSPFIAEELYQALAGGGSVHLQSYPESDPQLIDKDLEEQVALARSIVSLGRSAREEAGLKVRQPLLELFVSGNTSHPTDSIKDLITEELNVKDVEFGSDITEYLGYTVKPNYKVAGKALGGSVKDLASYLEKTDGATVMSLLESGGLSIQANGQDIAISEDMLDIRAYSKEGFNVQSDNGLFAILNTSLTDELINEGLAREAVSKIQQLRKSKGFDITDRIDLKISAGEQVLAAFSSFGSWISDEVLAVSITVCDNDGETVSLNGYEATIDAEKHA
ncbi:MAG: isoleucine--tRNA ligase [Eubacteriaceae bacterium]|nr:isoleucine--tRNA ligase [Eubacteriaceae bacterium]